jgi:hypothetical protein
MATTHFDGLMYDVGLHTTDSDATVRKTSLRYRPFGIIVTDSGWEARAYKECHANPALQP